MTVTMKEMSYNEQDYSILNTLSRIAGDISYGMLNDKSYGLIDDLTIQYNGNQRKNIPLKVWSDDGKNIIEYVYAADGRKLRIRYSKKSGSVTVRDFRGGLEVVNGDIDRINFQGGFYSYDWIDDYYSRNYYIQDYQGNIRMTESSDDWGGIVSEYTASVTDYYPYGNPHRGGSDYKYSGKYLDRTYGLDLYDFEARRFDAIVPVFDKPDDHATSYYSISPYVYCAGDPVNLVDPTGCDWYKNDSTGNYTWFAEKKDREGYTYVGEKGSMLGELESQIDELFKEQWPADKKQMGIYEEGTVVNVDNSTDYHVSDMFDWLSQFQYGNGPEIRILTNPNHPYVKQLAEDDNVQETQSSVKKKSRTIKEQTKQWMPWDHFTRGWSRPIMNFVGTFDYKVYSTGRTIACDRKSFKSYFYHIPGSEKLNHNRSSSRYYGNTYQFYVIKK